MKPLVEAAFRLLSGLLSTVFPSSSRELDRTYRKHPAGTKLATVHEMPHYRRVNSFTGEVAPGPRGHNR